MDHEMVWRTPTLLLCHLPGRVVFIRTTQKGTEQLPGPCVVDANIINFLLPLPLVTDWGCKFSRMISIYKEP